TDNPPASFQYALKTRWFSTIPVSLFNMHPQKPDFLQSHLWFSIYASRFCFFYKASPRFQYANKSFQFSTGIFEVKFLHFKDTGKVQGFSTMPVYFLDGYPAY
ncbi:MAG: hypothetical protein SOY96_02855, partial [Lachnospiraceae bacterium]|nr:hypothetical protein [Lachnospiraceae bacterium]